MNRHWNGLSRKRPAGARVARPRHQHGQRMDLFHGTARMIASKIHLVSISQRSSPPDKGNHGPADRLGQHWPGGIRNLDQLGAGQGGRPCSATASCLGFTPRFSGPAMRAASFESFFLQCPFGSWRISPTRREAHPERRYSISPRHEPQEL
jgi:hypothetical protein